MNERIKELYDQCWFAIDTAGYQKDFIIDDSMGYFFDAEKFAELIVRECAEIGDNYQDILEDDPECFNCRKVAYGIVDKIKQHFGVEE